MTFLSFPIHSLFIPYSFPNDSLGTEQKKEAVGDISIVGLSKIYRSDDKETVAIKEFNLEIKKGELISIVGPSGCGKTTLLRCIAGLEEPTTGTISSGI